MAASAAWASASSGRVAAGGRGRRATRRTRRARRWNRWRGCGRSSQSSRRRPQDRADRRAAARRSGRRPERGRPPGRGRPGARSRAVDHSAIALVEAGEGGLHPPPRRADQRAVFRCLARRKPRHHGPVRDHRNVGRSNGSAVSSTGRRTSAIRRCQQECTMTAVEIKCPTVEGPNETPGQDCSRRRCR